MSLPPRLDSLLRGGVLRDDSRRKEFLTDLDGVPEFVETWADLLGLDSRLDRRFSCALPEHRGGTCKARLWRDRRGLVVYRCGGVELSADETAQVRRSLSLTQVY